MALLLSYYHGFHSHPAIEWNPRHRQTSGVLEHLTEAAQTRQRATHQIVLLMVEIWRLRLAKVVPSPFAKHQIPMGQAFLALEALKWCKISIINWAPGPPGRLSRPTWPWVGLHTLMTGTKRCSCLNAHVWRYLCLHFICAKADEWQHLNGSSSFYPIQRSSICGLEFPSQFKHPQVVILITWRRKRLRGHMEGSWFRWMPEDRHCSSFFLKSYMNNPAYTKYTYDIYNSYTHILIYCKYILLSLGILHGFPFPHHFYESTCLVTTPDGAWWIQDTFGPLPIPIDSTFANIALASRNFSRDEEINRWCFDPFLAC